MKVHLTKSRLVPMTGGHQQLTLTTPTTANDGVNKLPFEALENGSDKSVDGPNNTKDNAEKLKRKEAMRQAAYLIA